MEQRHMELREDMDRRQNELLQVLKLSLDGIQLNQHSTSNATSSSGHELGRMALVAMNLEDEALAYRPARLAEATTANQRAMKQGGSSGTVATSRKPGFDMHHTKTQVYAPIPSNQLTLPPGPSHNANRNRRTISPAEMQAKRVKRYATSVMKSTLEDINVCCLNNYLCLFVLELEDADDEGLEELTVGIGDQAIGSEERPGTTAENSIISLCALSGIEGAQTIHLMGYNN
ncbi:hypothetical protein HAX54_021939 [Datura stramonium]|uniref:Uncharacterized protein n=1 Tax=Datura stramonium TaxID=4076 RepID=A0ABS8UTG7_DATST|nr:hypothetical protein [Datura stramonium]